MKRTEVPRGSGLRPALKTESPHPFAAARGLLLLLIACSAAGCGAGRAKNMPGSPLDALLAIELEPVRKTVAQGEAIFVDLKIDNLGDEAHWLPVPIPGSSTLRLELVSPEGDTLHWKSPVDEIESEDSIYLPAYGTWVGSINLLEGFGSAHRPGGIESSQLPAGSGYRLKAFLECEFEDLETPIGGAIASPPAAFDVKLPGGLEDRVIHLLEGARAEYARGAAVSADAALASIIFNYPLVPATESAYFMRFELLRESREKDAIGLAYDFLRLYPDSGFVDPIMAQLVGMLEEDQAVTFLTDLRDRYPKRRVARYASKHFVANY